MGVLTFFLLVPVHPFIITLAKLIVEGAEVLVFLADLPGFNVLLVLKNHRVLQGQFENVLLFADYYFFVWLIALFNILASLLL